MAKDTALVAGVDNLTLALLRDMRREQSGIRTLLLGLVDQVRRFETRVDSRFLAAEQRTAGLRDDLEFMIKAEIMGRLTHLETVLEDRIDRHFDRDREPQV